MGRSGAPGKRKANDFNVKPGKRESLATAWSGSHPARGNASKESESGLIGLTPVVG